MANEVTIDSIQIEIEAESASAASSLDKLAQSLDRLQAVTQRMTVGGDGLNKVAKQIEKLNTISQKIQSMRGFERLGKVVNQLSKLDRLSNVGDISGFIRNLNKLPQAVNAIAQMPSIDATKFQQIADALKPLETVSAGNINSLLNALRKLPKLSQELAGADLSRLESQIRQISTAIEPLVRQAERGGAGLTALAQIMQNTNRQAQRNTGGFGLFNQTIGNIKVKTLAAIAGLRRLFNELKKGVIASAAYVENLNLFNVTMGDSAGEALKFAEAVNSALGVDTSDWIRYQGVFQSIAKGFGIVSEKADVMSKNLTQLTYDISSFYNISADTAGEKLQSALSGQVMPMRQLGFAIEETTLKQVALNHGIEMSVENMTQAQKAQLRYVAIMEQAGNIGVLGDMARTIDTAANGMRVLQARMQQFARAIGNMVMPVLSAVLPYLTAFVQVLTEGAQAIANFFGFELPKIDFSGASVSSGYDDITASVDEATKATEKFKGTLSSVDQLNIIGSHNENGNGDNANQFDLGIELPEYDFLQGVESKTKQIAENIKAWFSEALPWIEAVGTAIGTVFIASKINSFLGILGKVRDTFSVIGMMVKGDFGKGAQIFSGVVGGLAAGASSGILLNSGIKNLIKGTGDLRGNWVKVASGAGIAAIAIAKFASMGNPLGAVITAVGALAGVAIGAAKGVSELANEAFKLKVFDDAGVSIKKIADEYSDWTTKLTENSDKILANQTSIENNKQVMSQALDVITDIGREFETTGNLTEDAATKISEACKNINNAISTNLNTQINDVILGVGDKWDVVAQKAGAAKDEVIGAYYTAQQQGNVILAELKRSMDESLATLATSEKGSAEYNAAMSTFTETRKKYSDIVSAASGKTEEVSSLESRLAELTPERISLMDADTALVSLKQITAAYTTADDTLRNAKTAAIQDNLDLKNTLKAMGVELPESYWEGMNDGIEANYQSTVMELYQKTNAITNLLNSRIGQLDNEGIQAGQEKIYNFSNPLEFIGTAGNLGPAFWKGVFNGTSQELEINKQIREQTGFDKILEEQNKLQAELKSRMPNYETNVNYGGGFRPTSPGGGFRPVRPDIGSGGGFRPDINSSLKSLQTETATVTKEYGAALTVNVGNGAFEKQSELERMISDTVGGAAEGSISTVLPLAKQFGINFSENIALGINSSTSAIVEAAQNAYDKLVDSYNKSQELIEKQRKDYFSGNFTGPIINGGMLSPGSKVDWYGNGSNATSSPGEMEATITIYNQLDVDGETVAEKVNDINARLLYRSNGR